MAQTPEPESLHFLLSQVCRLKHSRAHTHLDALGLYRGQPSLLRALWEREGLTHTELAHQMRVQPATITKMLKRMEKAGFVTRKHDLEDQRVSRVYLTEAGRAIQARVQETWRTLEEEVFAGFTLEERVLLRRFLLQMRENLTRASKGV